MKNHRFLTFLLISAPLAALHATDAPEKPAGGKTNIIVIITDFMNDYTASHALDGTVYQDAPRPVTAKGCRVVLQTEWALQFLNRRAAESGQEKPFFLYLAYMAPHTQKQRQ